MFKPTWLYIKQHRVTGLKYLGKTTRPDVHRYCGSGKRWKNHLMVHGNDVETIWCQLFEDETACINKAFALSIENNVVESDEWANLKPETVRDGSLPGQWVGEKSPMFGRRGKNHPAYGRKDTDETNRRRSISKFGNKNPMYGVKGKDHPCSDKDQDGLKNPNSDHSVYVFEEIETGRRLIMTRNDFKKTGVLIKSGVDRLCNGTLSKYKGWQIA